MNQPKFLSRLPWLAAGLGGLCGALRALLYALAADGLGLLTPGHPLDRAVWLLSAAALVFFAATVWRLDGDPAYDKNFAPSYPALAGHVFAAAGFFLTVFGRTPTMPGALGMAWKVLGYGSALGLLAAGWARFTGKKPSFALHLIPCLFLVLQIVEHYRAWSGTPQAQSYLFAMLGTMALMLFAFYQAGFDVDLGKRRMLLFYGLTAVYLCLAEALHTPSPWLYLGGAAWAGTGLCNPVPSPKPPKPPETEAPETPEKPGEAKP